MRDTKVVETEEELREHWKESFIPGMHRARSLKTKLEGFKHGLKLYRPLDDEEKRDNEDPALLLQEKVKR